MRQNSRTAVTRLRGDQCVSEVQLRGVFWLPSDAGGDILVARQALVVAKVANFMEAILSVLDDVAQIVLLRNSFD